LKDWDRDRDKEELMRWIVFFEDTAIMLAVRKGREQLHLEYLREHMSEILLAGGCRTAPEEPPVGGLWVLEVESKERAIELIENDPYFKDHRRTYRLLTWGKAFPEITVQL
jgi:uncharacterized protein YciI